MNGRLFWSFLSGLALGVALTTAVFMAVSYRTRTAARLEENLTSEQKLELYKKIKRSAVIVRAYFQNTVSYGSGVVILLDRDRVVAITNAHVVKQGAQLSNQIEIQPYGSRRWRPARVLKHIYDEKEQIDVAYLLYRELVPADGIDAKLVPPNEPVLTGQPVYAIGHPKGEQFFPDDGVITEIRSRGALKLIVHNALTEHGSSGGGLFDQHGHLLGINTWLLGNNLGVAAEINSLMRAHQIYEQVNKSTD